MNRNLTYRNFLIFVFVLLVSSACKEPYWPEMNIAENILVVDGSITNEPGPYTVRLSFSSNIDSARFIPVSNCRVFITDDLGHSVELSEDNPGIYITTEPNYQGEVGRQYKLQIITPDEREYESSFQELLAPVGIDSVYAETEYRQDPAYDYDLAGYQFYVDTKIAEKDTNYCLLRAYATYHYKSDFTIRWYYDGTLNWFHGPDSLLNCWKTYTVGKIFTLETASLSVPQIKRYPLHFVNTETRELSIRYSLLVKQYTTGKEAYTYWNGLGDLNNDNESLYSIQPYQLRSNVKNIRDEQDPVLGYFIVAGVAEKRIFVDRPPYPVQMHYSVCQLNESHFQAYGELSMADASFYPIYVIETNGGRRAVPGQGCVDCRLKGGTITKPDFWTE